jgi:hypothetical protein
MAFHLHERFQAHCQYCQKIQEADTTAEAVALVERHEKTECLKNRHRLLIESQIAAAKTPAGDPQ